MKAQVEMIGLVIVVLLLVFGGLLYFRFVILAPVDSDTVDHFTSVQSRYLLSATMSMTLCEDTLVKDALVACSEQRMVCGQDACSLVSTSVTKLVSSFSFADFQFLAETSSSGEFLRVGDCLLGIVSPRYYFTVGSEVYSTLYRLC